MRRQILILFSLVAMAANAEVYWLRAISNYTRKEYKAGNQNWMIDQSDNGWMVYANSKGLLEFNGADWTLYRIGNHMKARSVRAIGDRVYVGGVGEFGYFSPNERGTLVYHRLSEVQRKEEKSINVWNILNIGATVYFQADNSIFIYADGKLQKVACPQSIECSGVIGTRLYVATASGLFLLSGRNFVQVVGTESLRNSKTEALLAYDGGILAITANNGIYHYKKGVLRHFDNIILPSISCADINGDILAVGMVRDGLALVDLRTGAMERLSLANGLQNKSVLSVKFDLRKNLWLGYDNGIDYISMDSPMSFLNSSRSAIGSGYASCVYAGRMYLGTNQGLYDMNVPDSMGGSAEPQFVPGTSGQVHCLADIDGTLFCGGRYFFITMQENNTVRYDLRGVWNVTPIGNRRDAVLLGTYWGLYIMRRQGGKWSQPKKIPGSSMSAKNLCVEEGANAVWVANKMKGLARLVLTSDFTRIKSEKMYNTSELPAGDNVYIANVDGDIVAATRQGIFKYDITHDIMTEDTQLERLLSGKTSYSYLFQDHNRNLWYAANGMLFMLRYDKRTGHYNDKQHEAWLNEDMNEDFENVYLYGNRAIIGTEDGYAMLRLKDKPFISMPPRLAIHRIYAADSLICENRTGKMDTPVTVGYDNNSVRFEFGCTAYDKSLTVLYSYCLVKDGGKEEWSDYSPLLFKEYSNLDEGDYTFRVRTLINGSNVPVEAVVRLRVLPPWYRSWWAYIIYIGLLGSFTGYVCFRVRESRRRLIRKGELKLSRQENLFRQESAEKNREIEILRDEKMALELQNKSTALVQSRINVVRKNDMLQEIKKTVQGIYNTMNDDNMPQVKRKVSKLLSQINTNLDHDDDLQAFQTSFDAVYHDFFRTLDENFPELSHKDKMLCAYIRMNMLTKEIAPLLNISVRGVEISRYRLRKKLGLDERKSLTAFLQKL